MNFRKSVKRSLFVSLYIAHYFDILKYFKKKHVSILVYHRFTDSKEPFKVRKKEFEEQVKFLKKKYNFISLSHYGEFLTGKRSSLPDNSLVVTIDDGYEDNYHYAYPILKKYSVPATIFITTGFINKKLWLWSDKLQYVLKNTPHKKFDLSFGGITNNYDVSDFQGWHETQLALFDYCSKVSNEQKEHFLLDLTKRLDVKVTEQVHSDYMPLTWEQIKEMKKNGIEFGSHTCTHPILSKLDHNDIAYEVAGSKKEIESRLDSYVSSFCYPNGKREDINEKVINAIRDSGYNCAVTTVAGLNYKRIIEKYLLKRLSIPSANKIKILRELTRF